MDKPNVILMLVDDLGYGDLSCLNEDSKIHTPNIDVLAERGMTFCDAHSTSALCTPSRYGLLTGRYNWRSTLKSLVLPGGAPPLIEKDRMTLADLFRQNGYFTACVGKWHLGLEWARKEFDGSEYGIEEEVAPFKGKPGSAFRLDGMDIDYGEPIAYGPNQYGFDYFYGTAASLDQPPYTYIENDRVLRKPDHMTGVFPLDRGGPSQMDQWQRGPAAQGHDFRQVIPDMNRKVLELIEEHEKEPFFIYYPTQAVHGPLLPPKDFEGRSGLNAYADMVLYTDYMVGEITAKLKEKGLWDDTVFLFLSDNGCSGVADYPFLTANGHNPSYIFRGKKSEIYEGGHRVPAILSWPRKYQSGKKCGAMICHSDWFATFAQMLGTTMPENAGEDSFDLSSLLDGSDETVRETIVHSSADGSFSIRDKEWKLELCSGTGSRMSGPTALESDGYQLYNLNCDIGETRNQIDEQPEVAARLKAKLLEIIENGRSTSGPKQENTPVAAWPQYEKLKM